MMTEKHWLSFCIGYILMFTLHYFLEPTWRPGEPRPHSMRVIFNYSVGTLGICIAFLYLHPEMLFDLFISVAGAGIATIAAHSRDWLLALVKRDQANGLIEESKDQA